MQEKMFADNAEKINKVIKNAMNSPYYRKRIEESIGELTYKNITYEEFIKLPVMTKSDYDKNKFQMITNSNALVNKEYYNELLYGEKKKYLNSKGLDLRVTSGSTGMPVEIIKGKNDVRRDYIILNYMRAKLTKYNFKGKFVWIWPINPVIKAAFYPNVEVSKWWRANKYGVQYMLYEHSDKNFEELYNYIRKNNVEWITASPTVLINFATFLLKRNLKVKLCYIECHSEYLYEWQRELIIEIFGCFPMSIYSSNEVQFMGNVCKNGNCHIFENGCFVELINNEYGSKDICVTSLNYFEVPIIRYMLGDCGEWNSKICTCGQESKTFKLSRFRKNDYIILKNGNRMEAFVITDSILLLEEKFKCRINMYHVIQKQIDKFEYYFEKEIEKVFDETALNFLQEYFTKLLKDQINIKFYFVNVNQFTFSGKKFKYFEVDKQLAEKQKISNNNF